MSWLGRAIGAIREGRQEARAVKTQFDIERLSSIIQASVPPTSRPQLAAKITAHLQRTWEEGKPLHMAHVPGSGLTLYEPYFLQQKATQLWDLAIQIEKRGGIDAKIDAYAHYIAAYYMSAMIFLQTLPDFGGNTTFAIMRKVKELCEGAPDPFPHFV